MKRTCSKLGLALPVALLLSAAMPLAPAFAKKSDWVKIFGDADATGVQERYYNKARDVYLFIEYHNDGTIWLSELKGDPGPDDSTGKGLGKPDVAGLIKKGLVTYEVRVSPEKTPLWQWVGRGGKGLGAHGNPGDQDNGRGPAGPPKGPDNTMTVKEKADLVKLINFTAKSLASIGQSMAGFGDSSESAPTPGKTGSGKGGGKNNNDQRPNSDNQNKTVGKLESLGPKPELVNPPPKNRLSITPGLLDSGTGFGTQGPAGAGIKGGSGASAPIR